MPLVQLRPRRAGRGPVPAARFLQIRRIVAATFDRKEPPTAALIGKVADSSGYPALFARARAHTHDEG